MASEVPLEPLDDEAGRDGASRSEIAALKRWAGKSLPKAYLDFLRKTKGYEDFISEDNYLVLWSADQIPELNEGYSLAEFAPRANADWVGRGRRDTGFAFDTRQPPMLVLAIPLVGMSLDESTIAGTDFLDFLGRQKAGWSWS